GKYVYFAIGHYNKGTPSILQIYTITGMYVGHYKVDGSIGDYNRTELKNKNFVQSEPEGIDIRGNKILYQTTDVWKDSSGKTIKSEKVIHEITNDETGEPINRGYQDIEPPSTLHLIDDTDLSVEENSTFTLGMFYRELLEMKNMLTI